MKLTRTARRWFALIAAITVLTLGACSASTESFPAVDGAAGGNDLPASQPEAARDMADAAPEAFREQGTQAPGEGTMLIVNKTLRMEVPAADAAVDEIRKLAVARQASITDMEIASDDGWVHPADGDGSGLRAWLVLRVPASEYEALVADVAGLGEVVSQSEASTDVTQEHIDLSARLKNLRAQEERLREFFDKAADVKEMLAIEAELGRVRGDIESLDAQVKHLERQAAMVTLTLHLTEPDAVVSPAGDSWGFREAITNGLRGAVALVNGAVAFLIATSPLWLVGLIVFFPARAWLRRRNAPSPAPTAPGEESSTG